MNCRHIDENGDKLPTWWLHDSQGIPCGKVCDLCEEATKAKYRPVIFSGYTQADVDEPIEPEDDSWSDGNCDWAG